MWPRVRDGERDGAGTRAQVEHPRCRIDGQTRQRKFDQGFGFGPGDEHRRRHCERESMEFARAGEIGDRLAFAAACNECRERIQIRRGQRVVRVRNEPGPVTAEHMGEQYLRIQRIESRPRERLRDGRHQRKHSCRKPSVHAGNT